MYLARELITRAYWLSKIVSRELQQVSGSQMSEGLRLLNLLLDSKGSDLRLIPYFQRYEFPLIKGQEEYFIPGLLDVETVTFNLGVVRFGMTSQTRKAYFGMSRVDNIQSLPFTYRLEREKGGSRLYVYFEPAQSYECKITGKFGLPNVGIDENLDEVYDDFYLEYIRYALARYLCSEYGVEFPVESNRIFEEIRKKLMDLSPIDLSVSKLTYVGGNNSINWAIINLSQGYLPPGGR